MTIIYKAITLYCLYHSIIKTHIINNALKDVITLKVHKKQLNEKIITLVLGITDVNPLLHQGGDRREELLPLERGIRKRLDFTCKPVISSTFSVYVLETFVFMAGLVS